jgi:hypothetical protein
MNINYIYKTIKTQNILTIQQNVLFETNINGIYCDVYATIKTGSSSDDWFY